MSEQENTYGLPDERTLRLADAITGLDDDLIGEAHAGTKRKSFLRRTAPVWISAACLILVIGIVPRFFLDREPVSPDEYTSGTKKGGMSFDFFGRLFDIGKGGSSVPESPGKTGRDGTTPVKDVNDDAETENVTVPASDTAAETETETPTE